MVWLYYTSILILVGGEINSQVYNKLSRKADEIRDDLAKLSLMNKLVHKVKKSDDKDK